MPVGGRSEVRKTHIYHVFTCMMELILGAWSFVVAFFGLFQKLYFLVVVFFGFSTTGSD